MDDQVLRRLDKIVDTQNKQAVTLERLTTSVEEHVRRSNLLEEAIKPLEKHVAQVSGAAKLISIVGVIAAIAESIYLIMRH